MSNSGDRARRGGGTVRAAAALALAAALLGLAACATPAAYQAATGDEGPARYGYSEHRVVGDRLRVRFSGNFSTPLSVVETYALRRAAELTLARGDAWFRVVERGTEKDTERWVSPQLFPTVGFGRYGFGGHGFGGHGFGAHGDRYRFGAFLGRDPHVRVRRVTRFDAYVVIETSAGPIPVGDPGVYDARAVLARTTPTVGR